MKFAPRPHGALALPPHRVAAPDQADKIDALIKFLKEANKPVPSIRVEITNASELQKDTVLRVQRDDDGKLAGATAVKVSGAPIPLTRARDGERRLGSLIAPRDMLISEQRIENSSLSAAALASSLQRKSAAGQGSQALPTITIPRPFGKTFSGLSN